jgi:hypothetical protein
MFRKPVVFLALLVLALPVFAQKMTSDDVVAKNLDSIGTAETRAAIQTFIMTGEATAKFVSQKDLVLQGRIVLASAGIKSFFGVSFNSNTYPGEQFISDGKKTKVAFTYNNQRSNLGNFVQENNLIIGDGLFGGVLSTAWMPANLAAIKGKISFDGIKKIDGKEAYALGYSRKGSGDLTITLFFDKETFRHIRTEYKRITSAGIGKTPGESSGLSEIRYRLVEDFSNFKTENGVTLPHNYSVLYTETGGQTTGTIEIQWNFNLLEFALNQKLDDKTFSTDTIK